MLLCAELCSRPLPTACPEIHMSKFQPPEPQNVTLFGDKVFTEVIKLT